MSDLIERARQHAAADVDARDRVELEGLIARASNGEPKAQAELIDRFSGPLEFGTAGLRGLYAAGESRMNRAVAIRATAGLGEYLIAKVPDAKTRGVALGRDGRRGSLEMQNDAAEVLAAQGFVVHFLEGTTPTPVTAFAVKALGAAAGIMITASHNPPAYNGYKVYFDNGAQIIPPHDAGIKAAIDRQPGAIEVARTPIESARVRGLVKDANAVEATYLDAIGKLVFSPKAPVEKLSIAYSALHGVGERVLRLAFARRGFVQLDSVAEQAEPDGAFPTVEFPNPEEPGALDLVLALARGQQSDLVLVNDPDADRLGVAVRDRRGEYVPLSGNEIGVLLGHYLICCDGPGDAQRLVMTTLVSSQMLKRLAADLGVAYAETLTGFKWIANEAMRIEAETGRRFIFGYEEALGSTVGGVVRDKDGIGAALVMAELAATLKAENKSLLDRLEQIRRAHGLFVSRQKSVTLPGKEGQAVIKRAMATLRANLPKTLGSQGVASVWDLSQEQDARKRGDVLVLELAGGGRVSVRPSGTEPKIKLYLEVVEQAAAGEPMAAAQARADQKLDAVLADLLRAAGL